VRRRLVPPSSSHDLVLHRRIAISRSSRSRGIVFVATRSEVVDHLGIEFLGRLLGRTRVAGTRGLLAAAGTAGILLGTVGGMLVGGSGLGLGLGLGRAFSERLGGGNQVDSLGIADDDLDL
jgi:hypothetical protein